MTNVSPCRWRGPEDAGVARCTSPLIDVTGKTRVSVARACPGCLVADHAPDAPVAADGRRGILDLLLRPPLDSQQPPPDSPRLTIGMATAHEYQNVWFTVQALRLMHAAEMPEVEIVVVDNAPSSPHGRPLQDLIHRVPNGRYIAMPEPVGTAAPRDRIFREAAGDAVLVIDAHVMLAPGSVRRLLDYYAAHPETRDLLHGPMLDDQVGAVHATHMAPEWRSEMLGTWAMNERGRDPDAEPFEIPMHGLGLFSCRRDAWLGFNEHFRGFGGEEGYIHEKFRRAGARVLCLPFLRWLHQFRPRGLPIPYRLTVNDKFRNYLIAARELDLDPQPALEHFRHRLQIEQLSAIVAEVRELPITPFGAQWTPADPSRGLGDVVAKATHATGIDRLTKAIANTFGVDCGCANRQEFLNRWFPFARS